MSGNLRKSTFGPLRMRNTGLGWLIDHFPSSVENQRFSAENNTFRPRTGLRKLGRPDI